MPNSVVCLDASFILRLLTSTTPDAPAMRMWREWHKEERRLVAPALLYYEVTNALHRYMIHGELTPQEASELLDKALALDIRIYGDPDLHRRALQMAQLFSLPAAYDAHYLALTEQLGAELWTADQRLIRAADPRWPPVCLLAKEGAGEQKGGHGQ